VLILRAGRIEAFGAPGEVLHRVVRTGGPAERAPAAPNRGEPTPKPTVAGNGHG